MYKGSLSADGNRTLSAKANGSLTVRPTSRAGTKVGFSDPVVGVWKRHRSTDKRYSGDNRLISSKSSHRRGGLAPRCRLITSWGWRRSQGSGCSPVKVVRELGSERKLHCVLSQKCGIINLTYIGGTLLDYEHSEGNTEGRSGRCQTKS